MTVSGWGVVPIYNCVSSLPSPKHSPNRVLGRCSLEDFYSKSLKNMESADMDACKVFTFYNSWRKGCWGFSSTWNPRLIIDVWIILNSYQSHTYIYCILETTVTYQYQNPPKFLPPKRSKTIHDLIKKTPGNFMATWMTPCWSKQRYAEAKNSLSNFP